MTATTKFYLEGNFAPVRDEVTAHDLPVEGQGHVPDAVHPYVPHVEVGMVEPRVAVHNAMPAAATTMAATTPSVSAFDRGCFFWVRRRVLVVCPPDTGE